MLGIVRNALSLGMNLILTILITIISVYTTYEVRCSELLKEFSFINN